VSVGVITCIVNDKYTDIQIVSGLRNKLEAIQWDKKDFIGFFEMVRAAEVAPVQSNPVSRLGWFTRKALSEDEKMHYISSTIHAHLKMEV